MARNFPVAGHLVDMARSGQEHSGSWSRTSASATLDGRRIAYATVGEGPPLVFGAKWVSHLEEEWDDPRARSFYEELAQNHLVVRYDRLGAGLSDRDIPLPPTVANETRVLETVIDATGGGGAGDRVRMFVRGDRDGKPRGTQPGARRQGRLLRQLRVPRRPAGGDPEVARSTSSAPTGGSRPRCLPA